MVDRVPQEVGVVEKLPPPPPPILPADTVCVAVESPEVVGGMEPSWVVVAAEVLDAEREGVVVWVTVRVGDKVSVGVLDRVEVGHWEGVREGVEVGVPAPPPPFPLLGVASPTPGLEVMVKEGAREGVEDWDRDRVALLDRVPPPPFPFGEPLKPRERVGGKVREPEAQ